MVLAYGQVYTLEASEARLASRTLYSNSRLTDAGPQSLHGETWPPRLQHPSSCEMGRSRSLKATGRESLCSRAARPRGWQPLNAGRAAHKGRRSVAIDPGTNTAAGCGHTSRRRTGRCEGSHEVRDALQGLAEVRLNALASMGPRCASSCAARALIRPSPSDPRHAPGESARIRPFVPPGRRREGR